MRFRFYSKSIVSTSDFEHAVAQMPDAVMRDADVLVLRADIELWRLIRLGSESVDSELRMQRALVRRRTQSVALMLVPDLGFMSDGRRAISDLADLAPKVLFSETEIRREATEDELSGLRQADLARLVEESKSRCVIHSSQNHHFLLPSGAHASQFVRVAEALVSMEAVDTIAYWLFLHIGRMRLGGLAGDLCLVVDNPSMLVVVSRVELFLREIVGIHSFLAYPRKAPSARDAIHVLDELAARYRKIVAVIGISSTGGLATLINKWIEDQSGGLTSTSVVSVYATGAHEVDAFCQLNLAGFESYRSQAECEICKRGASVLVPIDAGTYTLTTRIAKTVALKSTFFSKQRDFLNRFGSRPDVLRVHFDDPNERQPRHHAFYINVKALLEDSEFKSEIEASIDRIVPRPTLVLSPEHDVALQIGQLASARLGVRHLSVDGPLTALPEESRQILSSCESLLIVDDVMISGSRLRSINAGLREAPQLCGSLKSVCFFTPMATPVSAREHAEIVKGLTLRHRWQASVVNLYGICLPPWHESKDCPWCVESKIYSDVLPNEDMLESAFDSRLRILSGRRAGIGEDCLDSAGRQLPAFGDQSPILPAGATALQLTFAFASALQQLRSADEEALDPKGFPVATTLAVRNVSKNYDEKLLWLPLLRAIRAEEVDEQLSEFLFRFSLSSLVEELGYMRRELAIAMLSGKMGQVEDSQEVREFFVKAGLDYESIVAARYASLRPTPVLVTKVERSRRHRWLRNLIRGTRGLLLRLKAGDW